jgi:hypothetical protein
MRVEQLFVETLIDLNAKLATNPSEYQLLRVSGLLRQILIDKKYLLKPATAAAPSVNVKFRVIKPAPQAVPPMPPEVKARYDALVAALPPDGPQPFTAF